MHLFGDKNTFAICYRPYERRADLALAYCHLIFGGHFIGNKNESCLLATWTLFVEALRNHIVKNRGFMSDALFYGLTDREIFELIIKSNQLEEDFDPSFRYLPAQQTNDLWVKHLITLDETIDAYLIVVIEEDDCLKFIWKGWREPCPEEEIDTFFSVAVEHDLFISTIDAVLSFIYSVYPQLSLKAE